MPHASLKLRPGLDQNETPVLNEAGISQSQLIRFIPDQKGIGLIQKLGGWAKFCGTQISRIVRALWAWEDIDNNARLAFGCESDFDYVTELGIVSGDGTAIQDITPYQLIDNFFPAFSTTAGSAIVSVNDPNIADASVFGSVYIPTQVSVGGIVLFGLYPCVPTGYAGFGQFQIVSTDVLGNLKPATSTVASVGAVPVFSTTSGQSTVNVTLNDHGYSVGSTFPVLIKTPVGGIDLFGNYVVEVVSDANTFSFAAQTLATSTAIASLNNLLCNIVFNFGNAAPPIAGGYGSGHYGGGDYGVGDGGGSGAFPGYKIAAVDWTLDNWGEILIACPKVPQIILTPNFVSTYGGEIINGILIQFYQNLTVPFGTSVTLQGFNDPALQGTFFTQPTVPNVAGQIVISAAGVTDFTFTNATITLNYAPYQPIYQWNPQSFAPTATVLPYAPPVNEGAFVAMPQRQIIAYGSTETGILDPLLVRWCDVGNFNVWAATITNQAGSYRVTKGSKIVGAIQGPQQGILWTDVNCWSMQYIGPPYVYSFNELGTGCGLIAKKAAASISGVVYWMGPSQFFSLTGNGVQPVFCPVWDVIFQDLDHLNLNKIRVAVNSRFAEIQWFYPTNGYGDVSNYVKHHSLLNAWDFGQLSRSAWIDQSILGAPIGFDPFSMYIYQHEENKGQYLFNADTSPMYSSFQTGWFALSEGDVQTFVDQWWPDMKWGLYGGSQNAQVLLTIYAIDYPNGPQRTYGPYTLTSSTTFFSPRVRGRLISLKFESTDQNSFWRIGNNRYRLQQDGKY